MYKVVKTDGRHAAASHFQYYAEMGYSVDFVSRLKKFTEMRDYCISTWGNSMERDYYIVAANKPSDWINKHWCWHTHDGIWRLYFKTEQELNWFNLRWM